MIWARRHVATEICPKSLITAESATLVETFLTHRRLGFPDLERLSAREADAYLILESELRKEAEYERG